MRHKTPDSETKNTEPWKKKNPNPGKSKPLSPAAKEAAKRRAEAAGRPYPNLVDNMWAAKNFK
jgi:hypothetical protein